MNFKRIYILIAIGCLLFGGSSRALPQDFDKPLVPQPASNAAGKTSQESGGADQAKGAKHPKSKHPKPKQIIRRYISLLGGHEAIDSIETIHKKANVTWRNYKDTVFESFSHSDGLLKETYDYPHHNQFFVRSIRDGVGWEGFVHLSNRFYEGVELEGYLFRSKYVFWCTHWEDECESIDYIGSKNADGKKAYVLKMVFKNGYIYENYFDIETGLLFKSISKQFYQNREHKVISTILETKRVKGILMTNKLKLERDGEVSIYDYTELEIDCKISKDNFDFPQGMDKEKIIAQQKLGKIWKLKNALPPPPPIRIKPAKALELPNKLRLVHPKKLRIVPPKELRLVPPKDLRLVPPKELRFDLPNPKQSYKEDKK